MRSEFDAFIAQETLVPFEGLTWQFPRYRIQPYDDINWNGGPKTCGASIIRMTTKSGCILDEILQLHSV